MKFPTKDQFPLIGVKSKKGFIVFFIHTIKNFFRETSLHGFRHITQKYNRDSHISYSIVVFRSLLWVTITLSSIIFCAYLMILVWIRFETAPTQTVIETVHYPISQVSFPAVTICSINKVHESRTTNIKNIL